MRTITITTTEIEKLQFGFYDDEDEFITVDSGDTASIGRAAAYLKCSEELVTALAVFTDEIKELVASDLLDICKRLDAAGIK